MANTIFDRPDLSAFTRLDDLGLEVTGQRMWPDHAVLACRIAGEDRWCRRCGCQGESRDTVIRRLAHEPYGWRPTILHVSVRRYRCQECAHVWRQDMSQAADPRAKLSRAAVRWALTGLVVHHLTVARISQALGVSWNTANTAVLGEGQRLLINDPTRFDGVRVIGVDEHVWRHTPYGDKYVTVILDLTPIRERSGPSRLLDMVPGRSKQVFKTWLASRPDTWRSRIEIVAMDGFTGFKSAATEELPGARAVMDPFHVVHLAGNALDECRRRIQQELHHRRGRATDPLYKARRMLHTRSCLLTPRQQHQLLNLFSGEEHVALEVTWSAYQNIIDAYRAENIAPCKDCRYCWHKKGCSIHDGMDEVYRLLEEADNVVLASPMYFHSITGKMKALIDRFQVYWAGHVRNDMPEKPLRKGAILMVGGAPSFPNQFLGGELVLKNLLNDLSTECLGEVCLPNSDHDSLETRPDIAQQVVELAEKMKAAQE